jgi:tetratricopeptide (TPR) repeat protein
VKINLSKIKKKNFYLFFFLLTFILYGNSINNEYALDDNIVVEGNLLVEKGLSGITEIFSSHYAKDKTQSYGYRPIVILSFALENQIFSDLPASQTIKEKETKDVITRANVSHFINVFIYALTCIFLFEFLILVLGQYNLLIPLLTTLFFLIHPLHTEPVCNIKSRDELLMFLFMLLALISCLKYLNHKSLKHIFFALGYILISVLSKKSGIAIFGILPVILYFKQVSYKKIITSLLVPITAFIIIFLIKKGLVNEDGSREVLFQENPLVFSNDWIERVLLALSSSFFYLRMLIFPRDLSFYYGFNQIEIPSWKSLEVWLGVLFYFPVGVYGLILFLKRNVIGLGIVLWFGVMLGVINLFFPIVGIVADRFSYLFSLGFCITVVAILVKIFKLETKINHSQIILSGSFMSLVLIVLLFSTGRVMSRNLDWENYISLFRHDNKHLQNSAKANALLGDYLYKELPLEQNPQLRLNMFIEIEQHYLKAISIYPNYFSVANNLGTAYFTYKGDLPNAKKYFSKAFRIDSTSISATHNLARTYELLGDVMNAENHYKEAIRLALKSNSEVALTKKSHSYLTMMFVKRNDLKKAFEMYKNAVIDFPNEPEFNYGLANIYLAEGDTFAAIKHYEFGYQADRNIKVAELLNKLHSETGDLTKFNNFQKTSN